MIKSGREQKSLESPAVIYLGQLPKEKNSSPKSFSFSTSTKGKIKWGSGVTQGGGSPRVSPFYDTAQKRKQQYASYH